MNTKTVLFRIALSFSLLWLIGSGIAVWSRYLEERPQAVDLDTTECRNEYAMSPDGIRETRRSDADFARCAQALQKAANVQASADKHAALLNVLLHLLTWTILPIAVFLILGAFAGTVRKLVLRYFDWVRNG